MTFCSSDGPQRRDPTGRHLSFRRVGAHTTAGGRVAGAHRCVVITVGELRLALLAASDGCSRGRRLETLNRAQALDPLPVDTRVAAAWAALRLALRDAGQRMPVNDSWIAATAIARGMPVACQDSDYDGVTGLRVIRL